MADPVRLIIDHVFGEKGYFSYHTVNALMQQAFFLSHLGNVTRGWNPICFELRPDYFSWYKTGFEGGEVGVSK